MHCSWRKPENSPTHGPACQAAGISFIPLAIETQGGLSDATVRNHLWHWPPHRPTFWGLPPRVVPSPFPKACYLLMERERNSLDTSLSTTCSKRRRGFSETSFVLCLFVSVFFIGVCHVLPCVLICRFFWFARKAVRRECVLLQIVCVLQKRWCVESAYY